LRGDNGSTDGVTPGTHVDFPASSPYALACGGSRLEVKAAKIASEVVWNDGAGRGATGGGQSSFFPLPPWQAKLQMLEAETPKPLDMRGVPGVCGNVDPETGYEILVDGVSMTIGGTSAVAPLCAALIARINGMKPDATVG
jgi:kumamolisin